MAKIILMIGAILMVWSSNAMAQEGRKAHEEQFAKSHPRCVADFNRLCPNIPLGDKLRDCLREHIRDVSSPCLVTLAKFAEVRRTLGEECSAHIQQQCANVERGGGKLADCMRSAIASLSDTCKDALARAVRRVRTSD
jgi:tRNA A37 threonylcarbamoyladenosine dehydratase